MNNNARLTNAFLNGANRNQHPARHGHAPAPHMPGNIIRAKPPSHSIAPWEITRWVDPYQQATRR